MNIQTIHTLPNIHINFYKEMLEVLWNGGV